MWLLQLVLKTCFICPVCDPELSEISRSNSRIYENIFWMMRAFKWNTSKNRLLTNLSSCYMFSQLWPKDLEKHGPFFGMDFRLGRRNKVDLGDECSIILAMIEELYVYS